MKRIRKTETGIQTADAKKWMLRLMLCIASLLPTAGWAQCEAINNAFLPGENIDYTLYFNWKFIWIKAGRASLGIEETTHEGKKAYQMNLLGESKKSIDFFFKMRDTLTCVISKQLQPIYFRKGAEEGKRYTVDEAWFSYDDGVTNVKQRRTYRDGKVIDTEHTDSRCVFDMLSILAQARSYDPDDFEIGQKILFPMATGKRVEEQTLIFRGRRNVKAKDDHVYRCLVFSFVEYDKKNKEQEVITFYITDDQNHLPIRLDMFLNIGSAKAFLNHVDNNRYPLTSIVKEMSKKSRKNDEKADEEEDVLMEDD